jgi:signal transduction histidine kinase
VELRGNRTGWCVEVEDHGLGMTEEQLAHVFERFYRADPSCSIPGSGLGMALVQQIMKLHNGTISITSELGRGTCVTLWFPLV